MTQTPAELTRRSIEDVLNGTDLAVPYELTAVNGVELDPMPGQAVRNRFLNDDLEMQRQLGLLAGATS